MVHSGRRGFTLLELVVALLLAAVVLGLSFRLLTTLGDVGRRISRRGAEVTALRSTRVVLRSELRGGVRGIDWTPHPPDSVRLRSFRAFATVCTEAPDGSLGASRRAGRRPDPEKDSVLVLNASGVWSTADVVTWAPGSVCPDESGGSGGPPERWVVEPRPDDPVLLLLFETGSYHLSRAALRYRRDRGGRQPLTEEVLGGARFLDTLGVLRTLIPGEAGHPLIFDLSDPGTRP